MFWPNRGYGQRIAVEMLRLCQRRATTTQVKWHCTRRMIPENWLWLPMTARLFFTQGVWDRQFHIYAHDRSKRIYFSLYTLFHLHLFRFDEEYKANGLAISLSESDSELTLVELWPSLCSTTACVSKITKNRIAFTRVSRYFSVSPSTSSIVMGQGTDDGNRSPSKVFFLYKD